MTLVVLIFTMIVVYHFLFQPPFEIIDYLVSDFMVSKQQKIMGFVEKYKGKLSYAAEEKCVYLYDNNLLDNEDFKKEVNKLGLRVTKSLFNDNKEHT
jgi:hypothetical protein